MFNFLKKRKIPLNSPSFLIIGAQKAGTTALYEYLSQHGNINATEIKEMHFFNCNKNFNKGIKYYHSLFPKIDNKNLFFDASPGYLHNQNACNRIYDYNKNMKIIVLLRNPVERAYSAWNMYIKRYKENIHWFMDDWVNYCNLDNETEYKRRDPSKIFSFFDFINEELDFINSGDTGMMIEAPILSHGNYADQLKKYIDKFGNKNILIIENKDFKRNTIENLKIIEKFLTIENHPWSKEDTKPVFEGGYTSPIDIEAKNLLSQYYKESNQKLFKLIGKQYNWNDI